MKGIHINWTKPYTDKYNNKEYKMEQYALLVQLLSVLYWKQHYGEIVLYTDEEGLRYYKACGIPILDLYDEIDIDTLEFTHEEINPSTFWAGGKLVAIQKETCPFVMLDLDLFLTDNIEEEFIGKELVFSHFETLTLPVYPNPKDLFTGEQNLPEYNWSLLPGNVSLTYFNNEEFKNRYTCESIEYMRKLSQYDIDPSDQYNSRMVFAEQRLLTCIARDMNIKYEPLIKDIYNSSIKEVKYNGSDVNSGEEPSWFITGDKDNIDSFPIHHTWGYKSMLINRGLRILYTESIQKIIKKEFPEYEQYLKDPLNE